MFIIFKRLFIRLGIASISVFGFSQWASSQSREIELILTPRLCVLGESEQECSGAVTLHWQSPVTLSACLFQEGQAQPLRCWQQAQSGDHILSPRASRTVRFFLASDTGSVLADGHFQVLQQQNVHRKRRNPWSFY
ncbi:MAG TPA: DUF3019 domain-containing protein [Cellvibrionaceae bacterium]